MLRYKIIRDADGEPQHLATHVWGSRLLNIPKLNKGNAFTEEERDMFCITGKLPHRVETLDDQVARYYKQYQGQDTDIQKNIFLTALHDTNEILFFKLISQHLGEMLPIIYTPTVGCAVEQFSLEMRRPRGIYIAYPDRHRVGELLDNRLNAKVDLLLVTDGEGVLGIGDQGVGGMDISIAKLAVYTLCGGINPNRVLPIQLDVGTNNQNLLDDPMYLGWRHKRIEGAEYDAFMRHFVEAVKQRFPTGFLHWEDFGRENARKNLETYRHEICSFNDDMQGTGVVALSCAVAGVQAKKETLAKQRIIVFGAGTAGCGISDQIHDAILRSSELNTEQAYQCFWLIDRNGLLVEDMGCLLPFQRPYARTRTEVAQWDVADPNNISLLDVIKNIKPTILIGCSTVTGAFSEAAVREMAQHVTHPIIMPLSNPTPLAEAKPQDLYEWTKGQALVASGSPFPPVTYNGRTHTISQSNNALVFPGIGLGIQACRAKELTDAMLWASCQALCEFSPARNDITQPLLPSLDDARKISLHVAKAVALQAKAEGLWRIDLDTDLNKRIQSLQWEPKYMPFKRIKLEDY